MVMSKRLQVEDQRAALTLEVSAQPAARTLQASNALEVADRVHGEGVHGEVAASADAKRIYVIGIEVAGLVGSVGGWMCNMALAGWQVHVATVQDEDPRPLHILAGRPQDAETVLDWLAHNPPAVVAVSADLLADNATVRKLVLDAIGPVAIVVWGQGAVRELDTALAPVRYRPSGAAKAFKRYAWAAIEDCDGGEPSWACDEVFRTTAAPEVVKDSRWLAARNGQQLGPLAVVSPWDGIA
jgi:hypothetical protein